MGHSILFNEWGNAICALYMLLCLFSHMMVLILYSSLTPCLLCCHPYYMVLLVLHLFSQISLYDWKILLLTPIDSFFPINQAPPKNPSTLSTRLPPKAQINPDFFIDFAQIQSQGAFLFHLYTLSELDLILVTLSTFYICICIYIYIPQHFGPDNSLILCCGGLTVLCIGRYLTMSLASIH